MTQEQILNNIKQEKLRLYNNFIDLLIEAQKQGYTQQQIAKLLGGTQAQVSGYLNGINKSRLVNSQKYIRILAKELGKDFIG